LEEEEGREGGREEGIGAFRCSSFSTAAATAAVSSHNSFINPLSFTPPRKGGREGKSFSIPPFLQPNKAVKGLMTQLTPNFNQSLFLISLRDSNRGKRPARVRWERRGGRREGGWVGCDDGGTEEHEEEEGGEEEGREEDEERGREGGRRGRPR